MTATTQLSHRTQRRRRLKFGPISHVASSTSNGAAGPSTFTVPQPASLQVGDFMVMMLAGRGGFSGVTITNGQNWTQWFSTNTNATSPSLNLVVLSKPVQVGDPANWTVTPGTSRGYRASISGFRGVDIANPVAAQWSRSVNSGGPSTSDVVWPNMACLRNGAALVGGLATAASATSATPPPPDGESLFNPINAGGAASSWGFLLPWGTGSTQSLTVAISGKGTQGYVCGGLSLNPGVIV